MALRFSPVIRKIAINAVLVGVSCLAVACFAEIVLRNTAHRILTPGEWMTTGQIFNLHDPPVGFSLLPGSTQILVSGHAYTARVHINSAGLRDREHSVEKTDGVDRLLFLGDSFVYGQGVGDSEVLTRRMEELAGLEVINAGHPGYDLGQSYLFYRDRGYRYQADLVLLGFFINDLSRARELDVTLTEEGIPVSYQRRQEMVEKDRKEAPRGITGAISSWFRAHSLLYVLVRKRGDALLAGKRRGSAEPGTDAERSAETPYLDVFRNGVPGDEQDQAWQRAYRVLDELKASVESHGSRFGIIMIPAPFQISDEEFDKWKEWAGAGKEDLIRDRPQARVSDWCEGSATPCLNLMEAFGSGDRERLYFPYDLHWTADGHALAARSITLFLSKNQLP